MEGRARRGGLQPAARPAFGPRSAPSPPLHPTLSRSVSVPIAPWALASLASVAPSALTIAPEQWSTPQQLLVAPSALVDGAYHISLQFA